MPLSLNTVYASSKAAEVAYKIGKAQVCAKAALAGESGLIRALLLLVPCSAIFKAAYKHLILQVAGGEAERFAGMLKGKDVAPDAGTGKGAVIIPLCVPILNAI